MARTTSAIKAQRSSLRKTIANSAQRSVLDRLVRQYRKSTPTTELFGELQQAIDKAAKNNLMHKNAASRLKQRLAKRLAAGATAPKKAATRTRAKKTR